MGDAPGDSLQPTSVPLWFGIFLSVLNEAAYR